MKDFFKLRSASDIYSLILLLIIVGTVIAYLKTIPSICADIKQLNKTEEDQNLRLQRVEDNYLWIQSTLNEIKQAMKEGNK
jgi:hypothetical protein